MSSSDIPLQPPVPFADFEFAFDPALHNLFPSPPPLPSSADLFTSSETTDLLGFLDNFNWEFDVGEHPNNSNDNGVISHHHPSSPYPSLSLDIASQQSTSRSTAPSAGEITTRDSASPMLSTPGHPQPSPRVLTDQSDQSNFRSKPVLSTPQKRLNHIMSEQKRRNAIRDGYVQLTALLAPAGAPPGTGMPTRGRPKGSGSRGKGRCQGKSGILFRAVEYCRWMEESMNALEKEISRVEAAAGIHTA